MKGCWFHASVIRLAAIAMALAVLPSVAHAQATASIAGVVTDASGAVLPGVTVEASSPALIEKVRSVVTDGSGQYRLEQLRGGVYAVTFTLPGFNTIKREGLELAGSFAASVNAEMRVGAVEETVTVTGETPIVDIQSANRQRVINQELLEAIPTGRTPQVAAFMIPGVNLNNVDVGGTNIINTTGGSMSIHGGSVGDTRILIDGITTANAEGTGWAANMLPNMGSTQEVAVDYSSASAESITGGLLINMIPKTGGNRFAGSLFATAVNSSFQGSNNTDELRIRGLRTPNSLKLQYDINPGLGGPIRADKLWFYTSARFTRQANYIGGLFQNKNAFDITKWAYEPDESKPAFSDATEESVNLRLTWQATQANKFSFFYDTHWRCQCAFTGTTIAQEAAHLLEYPIQDLFSVSYTAALSSRILVEARAGVRREEFAYTPNNPEDPDRLLIPVIEQGGLIPGLLYRGRGLANATQPYQRTLGVVIPWSASMSYVTGSHSAKFGVYNVTANRDSKVPDNFDKLTYRFNNGVPNQLTQRATPLDRAERQRFDLGLYAQDKWTLNRLTLSGGIRFDMFQSYFPEQTLGPAPLVPNRNVTFPKTDMANWKDRGAADGRVLRRVRQRPHGVEGVAQQIRDRPGAAGHVWRYGESGEPPGQHRHPHMDRRRPRLRGRLRPDQRAGPGPARVGRRLLRRGVGHELRQADAQPGLRPRALNGWGTRPFQWEFSTSVQHQTRAESVGGRGLLPPLVWQLRCDRQPGPEPIGFRHLRHRDSGRPAAAGWRQHGVRLQGRQPGQGGAGAEQLLHAGAELRQADRSLERHGPDRERANPGGHDGAGRRSAPVAG